MSKCRERYAMMELDSTTQICAGHLKENKGSIVNISLYAKKKICIFVYSFFSCAKDSCRGDSGGPLMQVSMSKHHYTPRYFLVGIVSFGQLRCGDGPAIYTRLISYMRSVLDRME